MNATGSPAKIPDAMPTAASDPSLYALATVVATVGLVACDAVGSRKGRWVLKPIAATGFVLTAWFAGALDTGYGRWIFVGLLFSWVGDVALLARVSPGLFRLGLGSFLLGHVAYSVGFVVRGIAPGVALAAAAVLALPAAATLRWLEPHLSESMRIPVRAYVTVITIMVLLATATVAQVGNTWVLVGAFLFYLSDLAVARQRLVIASAWNGAWGTPLYFVGQVVLARTVG